MLVIKYKYISSKIGASSDAKIWYYLMQDTDLFCFTSNNISGVILKSWSNSEIKDFTEQLKSYDGIIFDDELKKKIIEINKIQINLYINKINISK